MQTPSPLSALHHHVSGAVARGEAVPVLGIEYDPRARDARFTITREHCGYKRPRWVLRFCGDWIASYSNRRNAVAGRINAINARRASL